MKTNVFFTSDTHFGHANIIKYSKRPFSSAREMDDALINNWNKVVGPNDIIYHLGDFCFGDIHFAYDILSELNGNIKFIYGNHDKAMQALQRDIRAFPASYSDLNQRLTFLGNLKEVEIGGDLYVLCHYAMRVWNKSHHGAYHLYGHSHGSLPDDPHSRSFDCGVDCHNYTPINVARVEELMSKKLWKPIDHHGERKEGGGVGLGKDDYEKAERKRLYEQLIVEFEKP